ncbi:MAG: hypothetical protein V8R14_07125 [Clostridia bacterium]
MADKYDVDAETSIKTANARIRRSTEDAFQSTVLGFTGVTTEESYINLQNGVARYALILSGCSTQSGTGTTISLP